jgi:hypothetical protein
MLSPVMYRFEDIPTPASALLTHFNPASHLLAAYHNALWRAEPMSLKVLPATGVVGIFLIAWLAQLAARPRRAGATGRIFTRWTPALDGWTGEDVATLIAAARGGRGTAAEIGAASGIGRLFADSVAIYPHWALAQLAFASAMAGEDRELTLDGILDEVRPDYLTEARARIERERRVGRRIAVVTSPSSG